MKQQLINRILQYEQLRDVLFYATQRESNSNIYAFCRTILGVFGISVYKEENFDRHFPELFSLRPEKYWDGDYWFSLDRYGIVERINLLTKAIAIAQEKLNTFNSLQTQ